MEDFITGWLTPKRALGHPVGILITDDGVIYTSDDQAGVVYGWFMGRYSVGTVPQVKVK